MARKPHTEASAPHPQARAGLTRKETSDANVMEYSAPQPSASNTERAGRLDPYRRDDAGATLTNPGPIQS